MPPRRKRITKLGEHLRAARQALAVDQKTFAAMNLVSERTLSRWENGVLSPTPDQRGRLLEACEQVPPELYRAVARVLGIELVEEEPVPPPLVAEPLPEPPPPPPLPVEPPPAAVIESAALAPVEAIPPAPPRPTVAELRAALDAVVYAAAEERDVFPRHLRAFGVELLEAVERLGLSGSEAARLVAARERTKVTGRTDEAEGEETRGD